LPESFSQPPALPAQSPSQRLELDRKGETIVLEPYAPNILRVTISLKHDPAVAAPGFGFVAAPTADGWSASQTERADIYKSDRIVATVDRPRGNPGDDSAAYFVGSAPGAHITLRTPEGKTLLEMTGWMQAILNQKDGTAEPLHDRRATDPEFFTVGATFASPGR
jgi:alpha-D-xyloside xylohydrolase